MSEPRQLKIGEVRYNEQGLVPVVIQDAVDGRVLMVAWMNATSLQQTLETGHTVFWSRSRHELWPKGATSGNVQVVESISMDCDGDTLLIQAHQIGQGACHTGARSCFDVEPGEFE